MTFLAYVGKPGDGKSYGAVENQILPMLKQGRRVVTNIPLHVDRIRETISTGEIVEFPMQAVMADPDSIGDYVTPGSVFVLDECWEMFPAGTKQDKIPLAWRTLLAKHRHMVDDQGNASVMVWLVQDLSMCSTFARALIHQTYLHTKLSSLGANWAYRIDIYNGAVTGQRPPEGKKVRTLNGKFSKDTFRLYKSHTLSQGDTEGAVERSGDSRALLWKRPIFIAIPAMLVLFVVFGLPILSKQFGKGAMPQKPAASVASSGPVASPPPGASTFGLPPQQRQETWQIVGSMVYEGDSQRDQVFLARGSAQVKLPLHRYCERDTDGVLFCQYDGFEINNAVTYRPRYLPEARPAPSVVSRSEAT